MLSQSDSFTLTIHRTNVICDSNYDPLKTQESMKLQGEDVQVNSTNTVFLAGTQQTQVTVRESTFKQCGT